MTTKRTNYGTIIDLGVPHPNEDGGNEAFMPIEGSVLVDEKGYMPIILTSKGEPIPGVAYLLAGSVAGRDEHLSVVFVSAWLDIGVMIHDLLDACERSGSESAKKDLMLGMNHADKLREEEHKE